MVDHIMRFAACQGIRFDVAHRMVSIAFEDLEFWETQSLWNLYVKASEGA